MLEQEQEQKEQREQLLGQNLKEEDINNILKELTPGQRGVLEALCLVHDIPVGQLIIEQTLDWCRRETDGTDDLCKSMRKKLGKGWDF